MTAIKDVRLIINPRSGHGLGYRHARAIRRQLCANGLRVHASFSRAVGDIKRQTGAAVAAGYHYIVVAGGDGTIHEAVNGVLANHGDIALGLIPIGTGNDFAKAAGLKIDWRSVCERVSACIHAGQTRTIDAGRCNDFFFVNGVGIGLDARVTLASLPYKWLPGSLAYVIALLAVLTKGIASTRARVWIDDKSEHFDVSMIVACNGPWLGGFFHIAPRCRIDSGQIQVVIAAPLTRLALLKLAPSVMRGTHEGTPYARFIDCRTLRLELEQDFPVESDGEVHYNGTRVLDIKVLPGALKLLV